MSAPDRDPTPLLACPRCRRPLAPATPLRTPLQAPLRTPLRCKSCHLSFPELLDLPWLFAEPAHAVSEWRNRFHRELGALDREVGRLVAALQDLGPDGREPTRRRLARTAAAHAARAKELRTLLAPLLDAAPAPRQEALVALRTQLPPSQGPLSYGPNVFRDWAWGDAENGPSAALVREALGPVEGARLVVGAGAGRLAHDLHGELPPGRTVALDLNPLLVVVAQRISAGGTLELTEQPIAPRDPAVPAPRRTLRAPAPAPPGLTWVLGDMIAPPFPVGAFDALVAPWFVDIVETDFTELAAQFHELLAHGGRLVIFGSLAFTGAPPEARYDLDEVRAILGETGFGDVSVNERTLPYLDSPASRHGRRETVLAISAVRDRKKARPRRPSALPEWLVRGRAPVPSSEHTRLQAGATQLHGQLLGLLDGERSLEDIAGALADAGLMDRDDAREAVRGFLITLWRESRGSDF